MFFQVYLWAWHNCYYGNQVTIMPFFEILMQKTSKLEASYNNLMLGSHFRPSPIDSESHRKNEECRQVQRKTPHLKKVDDSLFDEVERVLLLVDFCR